jgi:hypothetical protein
VIELGDRLIGVKLVQIGVKLVQLTFYKNRQNIWRDGNAYRFGDITGSRRLQP